MVVAHFVKRELETLFVHRFSADTMPVAYVFRNSAHYWALSGLVFGYVVYHPAFSHVKRTQNELIFTLVAFAYAELSNFSTHMTVRNLRPKGSRKRAIPRGYGFDWPFGGISFPNYFFEVLAWVVVAVWSGCWGIIPFVVVATVSMDNWAQGVISGCGLCADCVQKHRKYKREFPDYPKRKAMFPWIR
jgi:very-long-chain enoyl-CoA reductase